MLFQVVFDENHRGGGRRTGVDVGGFSNGDIRGERATARTDETLP